MVVPAGPGDLACALLPVALVRSSRLDVRSPDGQLRPALPSSGLHPDLWPLGCVWCPSFGRAGVGLRYKIYLTVKGDY